MRNWLLPICSLTIMLNSCMKDELAVLPHTSGNLKENQIEMMSDYRYQVYFNLNKNEVVGLNLKSEWDLGFECVATGWHVVLNGANSMLSATTTFTELNQVIDTNGSYLWNPDDVTGNLDNTAIGDWRSNEFVRLIDAGYDEKGLHRGLYKLLIHSVDQEKYTVSFAEISSDVSTDLVIVKVPGINFVSLSFDKKEAFVLEPLQNNWDLVFTQYTHRFEGNISYPVTGVLLNPYNTSAYVDSIAPFDRFDRAIASKLTYSENLNIPGYDWKRFIFDESKYVVNVNKVYVIQTSTGLYYKLRFIDFYNEQGLKGYPKFEFQEL